MNKQGFTLIELMIVIGIVLFLIKIMAPQYTKYYDRLRQTEVSINLSALHAAEMAYHIEHGQYTTDLTELKWKPNGYHEDPKKSSSFYTYGFIAPSQPGAITFYPGTSQAPQALLTNTFAEGNTFSAAAVAQHAEDTVEKWVVTHDGTITQDQ